jgi:hypothetical protein
MHTIPFTPAKSAAPLIRRALPLAAVTALLLAVGCATPPPTYDEQRPATDQLSPGNEGLQSKDVVNATDQMCTDLLSQPALNASDHQWAIVLTGLTNHSADPEFSYDAFSERLKAKLARLGHGRVALIENRSTYKNLQNQELEPGTAASAGTNPDYGLYITIDEMPNRATSYFLVTATLTDLRTRQQIWVSNPYEVQAARMD